MKTVIRKPGYSFRLALYSNYGRISRHPASKIGVTLKTGSGLFKVTKNGAVRYTIRLSIGRPLQLLLYLVPFWSYLTLNNIVTLKSKLEVTQDH